MSACLVYFRPNVSMRRAIAAIAVVAILATVGGCRGGASRKLAIRHYVRGQLLAEHGDIDAALAELAEAARQNPTLGVAYSAAGDIHRKRGDHELARQSYESACRANPYAFRPHYHLGLTYQALARTAKVVLQAREYLRQAVQVYLRAITIDPNDYDANLNVSACYYQLGKLDMAGRYCQAAVAAKPSDPHAYSNLGIIYDSQGRLYEAIRAYKASLEFDTHQPKLLMNLGSTYMRQSRLNRAIRAFELAAAELPGDGEPFEQIGSCRYRLGRHEQALEAYEKAIELDANSAKAHRGSGVVYMTMFVLNQSRTDYRDRALAAWHASLELNPRQADLMRFVKKYTPKYTGPRL